MILSCILVTKQQHVLSFRCVAVFSKKVKFPLYIINKQLSSRPWRRIGEWRYGSIILNVSTRWRWLVSFVPQPLYPRRKSLWYPLVLKWMGPSFGLERCEEKNLFLILEF
jgi:hypothetical protein